MADEIVDLNRIDARLDRILEEMRDGFNKAAAMHNDLLATKSLVLDVVIADIEIVKEDVAALKKNVTSLKESVQIIEHDISGIKMRVERIERRGGLVEA